MQLNLPIQQLQTSWDIHFPNKQSTKVQSYTLHVPLRFHAFHNSKPINLYFDPAAIILDSSHDIILGIPFLRHWRMHPHYCNHTYILSASSGHKIVIPLIHSQLATSCTDKYCLMQTAVQPVEPLPSIPPFIPSTSYTTLVTQHIKPFQTISAISSQTPSHELLTSVPLRFPLSYSLSSIQLIKPRHIIKQSQNTDTQFFLCLVKRTSSSHTVAETSPDTLFAKELRQHAITAFPQVFPDTLPRELPPSDRLHHTIDLVPDHKIPTRRLYRQSETELKETKRQITEYLIAGHARPSTSAFGAPVLLVKKKDGSMRMCIDYRGLNDITIKNTFPLPRIDDLHDRLGKATYFTKLDLYSGYHQIPIKPGDEHKTAFTSRYGTYEFLVMPFGLTNAPSTFQTAMNSLFHEWLDDFVIVYLDDILIYSPDQSSHRQHLDLVLQRLLQQQWYCKLKKCNFAETTVEYLGHIISRGTISIDPDKMKAVTEWNPPFKNLTEVQSFLGLIGYYRRFIAHFSHLARPLHEFSHKDAPFNWQPKHTQAVDALKKAITAPDCLAIFDPDRKTYLTTDACDYALGAVLAQQYDHGERPVSFISKALNETQQKYSMWEKELYAIVWSVQYFRPYLLSHAFTIRSDNKPSTQLIASRALNLSTSANNRVLRWLIALQTYPFTIQHQPGKANVVADALSRFPTAASLIPTDRETATACQTHVISTAQSDFTSLFQQAYSSLPAYSSILNLLCKGEYHPRFMLHDNLIVTRETPFRILVPDDQSLRLQLFQEIHDTPLAGHPGFHKLLSYVNRHFVGNRLRSDVLDFCRSCPQCQIAKPRHERPYGILMPLQPPEEPWQDVSIDFITKLPRSDGFDSIMVVVDRFSKMAHFVPLTETSSAPRVAELFLSNIVRLHGFPRSIVSDRDPRFTSSFWRELFALCQTTLRFSSPNHPQTDGQTERTNRTLKQYLRIQLRHRASRWSSQLPLAEIAYNNSTHSSTGFSPFYLVYQRHPNMPLDLAISDLSAKNASVESVLNDRKTLLNKARVNLDRARQRMLSDNLHKTRIPPFAVNDLVLVHKSAFRTSHATADLRSFDDRWFGPYTLVRVININAYEIDLPNSFKSHRVINITFLQPYRQSERFPRSHPDSFLPPPVEPDDDQQNHQTSSDFLEESPDMDRSIYEVQCILKCRLERSKTSSSASSSKLTLSKQLEISDNPRDYEFLVRWKGYPIYDSTWESYDNLSGASEALEEFVRMKDLPDHWNIPKASFKATTNVSQEEP